MAEQRRTYGYSPSQAPAARTPTNTPTGGNYGGRGPYQPPNLPKPPSMESLVNQQPLPVDQSAQYQQMLAMQQAQLAQLQGYGANVAQMQAQLNRGYAADPAGRYNAQLLAMYGTDPLAGLRGQIMQQYQVPQRMNRLVYGYGMV